MIWNIWQNLNIAMKIHFSCCTQMLNVLIFLVDCIMWEVFKALWREKPWKPENLQKNLKHVTKWLNNFITSLKRKRFETKINKNYFTWVCPEELQKFQNKRKKSIFSHQKLVCSQKSSYKKQLARELWISSIQSSWRNCQVLFKR